MASDLQQFDYSKAKELENALIKEINSINDMLNRIQAQRVESVREWWKGGSEEAFIMNFANAKKEVSKGLQKWLEEYKKLIQEVARTKQEQEDALKRSLTR